MMSEFRPVICEIHDVEAHWVEGDPGYPGTWVCPYCNAEMIEETFPGVYDDPEPPVIPGVCDVHGEPMEWVERDEDFPGAGHWFCSRCHEAEMDQIEDQADAVASASKDDWDPDMDELEKFLKSKEEPGK